MLTLPHVERIPMEKDQFLRQAEVRENCLVDWEEGVAIRMGRAHSRHGHFILHLCFALKSFMTSECGRYWQEVFVDFGTRTYGVDVVVLFAEHLHRHVDGRIEGPPDIVVEVLSDDSRVRDRTTKFEGYREQGVPWYWIGDPTGPTLEEYRLTSEGYVRTTCGTLESPFTPKALPGLTVALADLIEP